MLTKVSPRSGTLISCATTAAATLQHVLGFCSGSVRWSTCSTADSSIKQSNSSTSSSNEYSSQANDVHTDAESHLQQFMPLRTQRLSRQHTCNSAAHTQQQQSRAQLVWPGQQQTSAVTLGSHRSIQHSGTTTAVGHKQLPSTHQHAPRQPNCCCCRSLKPSHNTVTDRRTSGFSSNGWSSSSCVGSIWSGGSSRGFSSSSSSAAVAAVAQQASVIEELQRALQADESQAYLTPTAVVERLNRVIVGQEEAKKAVAIAFRNRWRRQRVCDPVMRDEISPKNLLLIGPTGCGKTEIARRLAKLAEAPFIKVEATKFTEVGYHGRDVDAIVRDLVEVAMSTVKARAKRAAAKRISDAIESHILHSILGQGATLEAIDTARQKYRAGELEEAMIEVDIPAARGQGEPGGFTIQGGHMSMSISLPGIFAGPGGPAGKSKEKRTMTVKEARPYLEEMETDRQFPPEMLAKEAVRVAEQEGIVFIDEIDKIVNPSNMLRHGSDPSAEGVQRDLLPLIEGSVISTKHGPVSTDHVLFIASGAFTTAKPSDMMAELQGRLPIRVELKGLTAADFERILTEPEFNMIYQQQRLLGCEGVELVFTQEAIREVAAMAEQINKEVDNIGARRLHTVLERLVEDISFEAPDKVAEAAADDDSSSNSAGGAEVIGQQQFKYRHVIDKQDVRQKLSNLLKQQDFSKFIL